jgi:hypothetical protein
MKYQKGDLIEIIENIPGLIDYKGLALILRAVKTDSMGGIYYFRRLSKIAQGDFVEGSYWGHFIDDPEYARMNQ